MKTKYRVYCENGKFFAEVPRRKYWLFGPWVTDIYENRGGQWRCQRTGEIPSIGLYCDLEAERYWVLKGEGS